MDARVRAELIPFIASLVSAQRHDADHPSDAGTALVSLSIELPKTTV